MAHGDIANRSHRSSTDPAMVQISVSLDTSIWTKRKRKIATRCITSGILDAGQRTCEVIEDIMLSHHIGWRASSHYCESSSVRVPPNAVDPDRLSDLLAVVMARLKIIRASDLPLQYNERQYLKYAEGESRHTYNNFGDGDILVHKSVPLMDFLKPDYPHVVREKAALCDRITNGEIITCNYSPLQRNI